MTREPMEIAAAGATLIGERWTGDGPTIVLLHAGVCDRRSWREVGERLGAAEPFRHVDDLLAVLDATSPGTPAWLVGSSMGGELALDTALAAPERVAGLVLLAPAIGGDPGPGEAVFDAAANGLAGAIDAAWTAGERDACNRLEVHLWLDGPTGPEGRVGGQARELALDMNRIVIANGEPEADGAAGLEAAGRLHEIAVPAVVACGELDVPTIVRRCAVLAGELPGAVHRSLPGRAHLPYLEAPDEVAALILGFVA